MTKRRAFLKQSYILGLSMIAYKSKSVHAIFSIPGSNYPEFFFASDFSRPPPELRAYHSKVIENRLCEFSAGKKLPWWFSRFQYAYPNTLDERVLFNSDKVNPLTYIVGTDGMMHLDDSSRQAMLYLDLIKTDPDLELLLAGVINCQHLHLLQNLQCDKFPIPGAAADTPQYKLVQSTGGFIWDQSGLCMPMLLLYSYWKSGGEMRLLKPDWFKLVKRCITIFGAAQSATANLLVPVFVSTNDTIQSHSYADKNDTASVITRPELPARIGANISIATLLDKLGEMLAETTSAYNLSEECKFQAALIRKAVRQKALITHRVFGTIYATEVDSAGNKVCMEKPGMQGLFGLPYYDERISGSRVYQNTRQYLLSKEHAYFQAEYKIDIKPDSFSFGLSLAKALTAATHDELLDVIAQLKGHANYLSEKSRGKNKPAYGSILQAVNMRTSDSYQRSSEDLNNSQGLNGGSTSNLNILYSELILRLLRINPSLLA